jgi:DNA repair exonuclease SbcCD nuclease subunit
MDKILSRRVDFVIISGDLFHVNLPDLESVRRVVEKLRRLKDHEIPVYAVYGSHDFSPNATAMIDVLNAGGLVTRVVKAELTDDQIKLGFLTDPKTGIKLCGFSGRSYALEREYYEQLDRESLEKESGFKIFVLHSAVEEVKPSSAAYGQGIAASLLPQEFQYYAGGHIHEFVDGKVPHIGRVVYPGTLFGSTFSDLELSAKGTKRGFLIVECKDEVINLEFVNNDLIDSVYREINGENRTSKEVNEELILQCENIEVQNKIVLLKLTGVLSAGKVSDIEFSKARNMLKSKGAEFVFINRRALTTRETTKITVEDEAPEDIEKKVFTESLTDFRIPKTLGEALTNWGEKQLKGKQGLELSTQLLHVMKNEKKEGETNRDYQTRIVQDGKGLLPRRETT